MARVLLVQGDLREAWGDHREGPGKERVGEEEEPEDEEDVIQPVGHDVVEAAPDLRPEQGKPVAGTGLDSHSSGIGRGRGCVFSQVDQID